MNWNTMPLIPQVCDAVDIPVIAAGRYMPMAEELLAVLSAGGRVFSLERDSWLPGINDTSQLQE